MLSFFTFLQAWIKWSVTKKLKCLFKKCNIFHVYLFCKPSYLFTRQNISHASEKEVQIQPSDTIVKISSKWNISIKIFEMMRTERRGVYRGAVQCYLGDVTKGVLPGYESLILGVSAYQSNRTTKYFLSYN